jgi:hypothetical protein
MSTLDSHSRAKHLQNTLKISHLSECGSKSYYIRIEHLYSHLRAKQALVSAPPGGCHAGGWVRRGHLLLATRTSGVRPAVRS